MFDTLERTIAALRGMSAEDSTRYFGRLVAESRNDHVKTQWDVTYERLGHDMHSVAYVSVVEPDVLLQVWLKDEADGIWIPEHQPWEISVVEFSPDQKVTAAKLGLIDSKWTKADAGRTYFFRLWGYFEHAGKVESFAFEKPVVYPG